MPANKEFYEIGLGIAGFDDIPDRRPDHLQPAPSRERTEKPPEAVSIPQPSANRTGFIVTFTESGEENGRIRYITDDIAKAEKRLKEIASKEMPPGEHTVQMNHGHIWQMAFGRFIVRISKHIIE